MAKSDYVNIAGYRSRCVNISYPVGLFAGFNHKSDVMLIQALFNYIGRNALLAQSYFNLSYPNDIPVITGYFDAPTGFAINSFQEAWSKHLLKADGVIHPAHYHGRIIKDSSKPLMAITLLHLLATDVSLLEGENYVEALKRLEPELPI